MTDKSAILDGIDFKQKMLPMKTVKNNTNCKNNSI